jgi:hypothetical protein
LAKRLVALSSGVRATVRGDKPSFVESVRVLARWPADILARHRGASETEVGKRFYKLLTELTSFVA